MQETDRLLTGCVYCQCLHPDKYENIEDSSKNGHKRALGITKNSLIIRGLKNSINLAHMQRRLKVI